MLDCVQVTSSLSLMSVDCGATCCEAEVYAVRGVASRAIGVTLPAMIDLHVHSTASDGTRSPEELIVEAETLGLSALALVDHDTLSGLDAFQSAGAAATVAPIPGVELSCSWYGGNLHIVGLFVDPEDGPLQSLLTRVRADRDGRNSKIVEALNEQGIEIDLADVLTRAKGETVGRPHIAAALVERGVCGDVRQAFHQLLGRGKPAFVSRYLPLPQESIRTIHGAGGVAVWAHPLAFSRRSRGQVRAMANQLKQVGLDGLETLYPDHKPDQRRAAQALADDLDLLASGGTDYHGDHSPGVHMGVGYGDLQVPDTFLGPLRDRAESYRNAS